MRHRIPLLFALLAGPVALGACGPSAHVQTPDGFATLEDQHDYLYRATTAQGVVLAVRAEPNRPKGNVDFWAAAIDRQLRRGGYDPDGGIREVKNGDGMVGWELRYKRTSGGRPYRFWTALFVTSQRVWCVEAGGAEEHFKPAIQKAVEQAIASLTFG